MNLFLIVSTFILFSATMVIYTRKVMYSVFFMILAMLGVAMHFLLLGATFFAVIQIIVYSGAIMILFIFVVMLLDLRDPNELDEKTRILWQQKKRRKWMRTGIWGLLLLCCFAILLWLHLQRAGGSNLWHAAAADFVPGDSFFPNGDADGSPTEVPNTSNTSSTSSTSSTSTGASQQEDPLSIRALSLALFGRFVLPFELLSVLFLSAMVGTIILVSKSDQ